MTQPIFRLVENSFYLEENFNESFEYSEVKELLKSRAEKEGYTEENYAFNFTTSKGDLLNFYMVAITVTPPCTTWPIFTFT